MKITDIERYMALIERAVKMIYTAVNNNDGTTTKLEKTVDTLNDVIGAASASLAAGIEFDRRWAEELVALASHYEKRTAPVTPSEDRARADAIHKLGDQLRAGLKAREAEEAAAKAAASPAT